MATVSSIEWTEQTWNPVVGCTKISPGCKHCYAETMAQRLKAMGVRGYTDGFRLRLLPERLLQPLQRRKPTTYFVNSMSDLFHDEVPDSFIVRVFEVMAKARQHRFQVLTKRAERMAGFFGKSSAPSSNVWIGVSVEDRMYGLPRIEQLRRVSASVRFLSVEPLLENLGAVDLTSIDWVIVGGESGKGARPCRPEWVESLRQQCESARVAFFFKQWGAWGADGKRRSKKANGRLLHDRTWDQYPRAASQDSQTGST